jgi:hypothetical protein
MSFLDFLWKSKRSQEEDQLKRPGEILHLEGEPGRYYPLTEQEILRLLHKARYADARIRHSVQVRLNQAMVPSTDELDLERVQLNAVYTTWVTSGVRPTPALAQKVLSLLMRS